MKIYLFLLFPALWCLATAVWAKPPPVFVESRQLTAHALTTMGSAALAECTKRGFKVGVSIASREGQLLYFIRHPLAGLHTLQISRGKAYTAASMGISTSSLSQDYMQALNHFDGLTTLQGGLPIEAGGYMYGGIGVSGATPQADEECARTGIGSILDELNFQ